MPFLQEYNIGMWSEEISCNTNVRVCWIINAHNRVSNKSEIRRKTIEGINAQSKNHGDENNRLLGQLPTNMKDLAVQSRTINHRGYTTEAVCILAYKPIAPVIRELIAMLHHKQSFRKQNELCFGISSERNRQRKILSTNYCKH
jgi:hypothetical protein